MCRQIWAFADAVVEVDDYLRRLAGTALETAPL